MQKICGISLHRKLQHNEAAPRPKDSGLVLYVIFQEEMTLAGMGGIEPPNGGIKIRCLTAWLHPIALKGF